MVFLILEAHGALHFSRGVNERAQRITGQRMVIAAGIYVIEPAGFVIAPFGVRALKEETFNLIGGVECIALFLVHFRRKDLQVAPDIGTVWRAPLIYHNGAD